MTIFSRLSFAIIYRERKSGFGPLPIHSRVVGVPPECLKYMLRIKNGDNLTVFEKERHIWGGVIAIRHLFCFNFRHGEKFCHFRHYGEMANFFPSPLALPALVLKHSYSLHLYEYMLDPCSTFHKPYYSSDFSVHP